MMDGTVTVSYEALWTGISLLNNAVVGIFGMILSAAFCDLDWTRKRLARYWGCMAVIMLVQGVVYCVTQVGVLRAIYPLVTHIPLMIVLSVMKRRTIWPIVSVLTAYLCCQIRRWIALFAVACIGGGSNTQEVAELIVTLPLLWGLLKFVAPSVRAIGRTKPSVQVFFGIMPAISYAFDYLTRIYTDMLERGLEAAVEFMPSVCCVLYLVFVLRISAENAARSRLEQAQESLRLQVSQATREISSLREADRQASTYRHDLRHHMQFLSGCIENGQTERAQAYIRQVCAEIEAQKVRRFCENEAVNLILSSFAQRAEDSGVPLRVRAEVPQFLPVAETDLCVLLSNALENALHACQRLRAESKDCDIEAVAYEKSGKFFLQVSNTCGPDVRFQKYCLSLRRRATASASAASAPLWSATTAYIPSPQITVGSPCGRHCDVTPAAAFCGDLFPFPGGSCILTVDAAPARYTGSTGRRGDDGRKGGSAWSCLSAAPYCWSLWCWCFCLPGTVCGRWTRTPAGP